MNNAYDGLTVRRRAIRQLDDDMAMATMSAIVAVADGDVNASIRYARWAVHLAKLMLAISKGKTERERERERER